MERDVYTGREVADMLGISDARVREMRLSGRIAACRKIMNGWLYSGQAIRELVGKREELRRKAPGLFCGRGRRANPTAAEILGKMSNGP